MTINPAGDDAVAMAGIRIALVMLGGPDKIGAPAVFLIIASGFCQLDGGGGLLDLGILCLVVKDSVIDSGSCIIQRITVRCITVFLMRGHDTLEGTHFAVSPGFLAGTEQGAGRGKIAQHDQAGSPIDFAVAAGFGKVGLGIYSVVIIQIEADTGGKSFVVIDAGDVICLAAGLIQCRKQHGCQNGDDGDNDQKFDQSKIFLLFHFSDSHFADLIYGQFNMTLY